MNNNKLLEDIVADNFIYRGSITHFTLEEGGEWFPVSSDSNWQDRGFALKFQNGDIWDPLVGWRHADDHWVFDPVKGWHNTRVREG